MCTALLARNGVYVGYGLSCCFLLPANPQPLWPFLNCLWLCWCQLCVGTAEAPSAAVWCVGWMRNLTWIGTTRSIHINCILKGNLMDAFHKVPWCHRLCQVCISERKACKYSWRWAHRWPWATDRFADPSADPCAAVILWLTTPCALDVIREAVVQY